jgi:hypothetical protein
VAYLIIKIEERENLRRPNHERSPVIDTLSRAHVRTKAPEPRQAYLLAKRFGYELHIPVGPEPTDIEWPYAATIYVSEQHDGWEPGEYKSACYMWLARRKPKKGKKK